MLPAYNPVKKTFVFVSFKKTKQKKPFILFNTISGVFFQVVLILLLNCCDENQQCLVWVIRSVHLNHVVICQSQAVSNSLFLSHPFSKEPSCICSIDHLEGPGCDSMGLYK